MPLYEYAQKLFDPHKQVEKLTYELADEHDDKSTIIAYLSKAVNLLMGFVEAMAEDMNGIRKRVGDLEKVDEIGQKLELIYQMAAESKKQEKRVKVPFVNSEGEEVDSQYFDQPGHFHKTITEYENCRQCSLGI